MNEPAQSDSRFGGPQVLTFLAVALVGVLLAVLLGYGIAYGASMALLYLGVLVVVLVVVVVLRERVWIIIPLAWMFSTQTAFFGLPLSIRNMAILLAFAGFLVHGATTHVRVPWRWHPLLVVAAANAACLVVTFMRHPVGFWALGSAMVGARPYFEIGLGGLLLWMILRLPIQPKNVARMPLYFLAGLVLQAALYAPAYFVPEIAQRLWFLYGALDIGAYAAAYRFEAESAKGIERLSAFGVLGMYTVIYLCGRFPPRTLFNPWRGPAYVLALAMLGILLSGYRNYLAWAMVALLVGAWLQRGWRAVVLAGALAVLPLVLLVLAQGRLVELPMSAQRALSFLPGQWSPVVLADAQASSEWRFKMWEEVLRSRMIKDWVLGDGLGINLKDFEALVASQDADSLMLMGLYHSGPLTTVHTVGIVGLLLLYLWMIGDAVYAVRCVRLCRNGPLQPAAAFLAILAIWTPFHFTLVFGGYDSHVPFQCLRTACLVLLLRLASETPTTSAAVPAPVGVRAWGT